MKKINMPLSIRELGIDEKEFMSKVPKLAERLLKISAPPQTQGIPGK